MLSDPETQERQWHTEQPLPLQALFRALLHDLTTLLREEIQLLKTETLTKLAHTTHSTSWMGGGGLLAYTGLVAMRATLIAFA